MLQKLQNIKIKTNPTYLIVISNSKSNLYININDAQTGKLIRVFSFGHISIKAVDHRKRTVFASEFGNHLGHYFKKLSLYNAKFIIKIKGNDPRSFALLSGFIKTGGNFNEVVLQAKVPHNGCRPKKQKRL